MKTGVFGLKGIINYQIVRDGKWDDLRDGVPFHSRAKGTLPYTEPQPVKLFSYYIVGNNKSVEPEDKQADARRSFACFRKLLAAIYYDSPLSTPVAPPITLPASVTEAQGIEQLAAAALDVDATAVIDNLADAALILAANPYLATTTRGTNHRSKEPSSTR